MPKNKNESASYVGASEVTEVLLKLTKTRNRSELFKLIAENMPKIIHGAGCSLFLVNPRTADLELVASTTIPKKQWRNAIYRRDEGKTGWVFKYGKFLYIPNENDLDYMKSIKPPVNIKSGKEKPRETKGQEVGPFMAAPIKSEDGYVIGVIRTPALPGKTEFTVEEQEIFKLFAGRLSEVIENANLFLKHQKLIKTYAEIGGANNIDKLLGDIVKRIPSIVGGGGCSVFIFDGERDNHGNKKFVLRASDSTRKDFQQLIPMRYLYVQGGPGLTAWVATTGKPLRVKDVDNNRDLNNSYPGANHEHGLCEINDVGPFLAAPIKDGNEVLGVIRIPRSRDSNPFEEIDEELLMAFADQLSLTIKNIDRKKTIDEIRRGREENFQKVFSPALIEAGRQITEVDYAENIKEFLESFEKDECIDNIILDSLYYLWCEKYGQTYNFPILQDFRQYENLLFELPGYRDHFIHQYQVFLLGSVIIDGLCKLSNDKSVKSFSYYYHDALGIPNRGDVLADVAWLITSTFHDVAYAVQRGDELFNKFFDKFMDLGENIVDRINVETIVANRPYGKLIDQLCDFHFSLKDREITWEYNPSNITKICFDDGFRAAFLNSLLRFRDHGVLGSLILLYQSDAGGSQYSTMIFPSALAIALHDHLLYELEEYLTFEKNPLAFLLRYCDLVHEWGRGAQGIREIPKLKDIIVYYGEDLKAHVRATVRFESNQLANAKIREATQVMSRLKSNDVVFEFIIDDNGFKLATEGR